MPRAERRGAATAFARAGSCWWRATTCCWTRRRGASCGRCLTTRGLSACRWTWPWTGSTGGGGTATGGRQVGAAGAPAHQGCLLAIHVAQAADLARRAARGVEAARRHQRPAQRGARQRAEPQARKGAGAQLHPLSRLRPHRTCMRAWHPCRLRVATTLQGCHSSQLRLTSTHRATHTLQREVPVRFGPCRPLSSCKSSTAPTRPMAAARSAVFLLAAVVLILSAAPGAQVRRHGARFACGRLQCSGGRPGRQKNSEQHAAGRRTHA